MATRPTTGGQRRGAQASGQERTVARSVLDDDALALGTRIRERRRGLGLSLVKLAEETDLSHPFLSQVERGHARPSITSLQRIAAALGVEAGWLFIGDSDGRERVELMRVEETRPWRIVEGQHEGAVRPFRPKNWPVWFFDVIEVPESFGDAAALAGETVCYVLGGTLEVDAEGELFELGPSDALFLASHVKFRFRSTSAERTHMVMIRVGAPTAPMTE
jgi:transcriptional regulator with XRE-family HTH domain